MHGLRQRVTATSLAVPSLLFSPNHSTLSHLHPLNPFLIPHLISLTLNSNTQHSISIFTRTPTPPITPFIVT